jgi:predicted site-specific integrase-resolvase
MAIESLPQRKLLNESETAAYLGLRPETLATWRSTNRYRLPYLRVGRAIRYRPSDVEKFLKERTVA